MRKLLLALMFLLMSVGYCFGEITFDTATSAGGGVDTGLTFSLTVAAGDNRMLIVGVSDEGSPAIPTGITYNGDALTKYDSQEYAADSVSLWYLAAPDVGTYDVVVTWGGNFYKNAGAIVLQGVAQTAPEAGNKAAGTGTTASVAVTTVANGAWVVDAVATDGGTNNMTCSASQTERWETTNGCRGNGSTCPVATGGTNQTVSWSLSSDTWAIVAASFAPSEAAGGSTSPPFFQIFSD